MKKIFVFLIIIIFIKTTSGQELPIPLREALKISRSGDFSKSSLMVDNYYKSCLDKGNATGMIAALTIKSRLYTSSDSIFSAIDFLDKATILSKKSEDPTQKAYVLMAKVWLDFFTNNYKNVVSESKEALRLIQPGTEIYLQIFLNSTIYNVYSQTNNWADAKPYIDRLRSLESEAHKIGHKYSSDYIFSNYLKWKFENSTNDLKLRDSVVNVYKDIHQKYYQGYIPTLDFVIAIMNESTFKSDYIAKNLSEKLNILESTEDSVKKIIPIITEKRNLLLGFNYFFVAKIQNEKNNFDSTIYYLKKANDLLSDRDLGSSNLKLQLFGVLVSLYESKNDFKNAYFYEKESNVYSKKLYEVETRIYNKRIEAQYQLVEKNAEIIQLKSDKVWQKRMNLFYLALLLLGGVSFFGYYKSHKFKLKYSNERTQKLKLERDEVELRYRLNLEEQARIKQEKEYLDIQHEQMKRELMLNTLHLEHKNNLIQNISENAKDGNPLNLQRILREENNIDMDFADVKTQIQDINPSFFNTLMIKSQQKLTNLDLKYCAYLHLNIDTKQIAQLLNVEPKSVRMSKYRIKQKLGLDKEEDLENYLKEL